MLETRAPLGPDFATALLETILGALYLEMFPHPVGVFCTPSRPPNSLMAQKSENLNKSKISERMAGILPIYPFTCISEQGGVWYFC